MKALLIAGLLAAAAAPAVVHAEDAVHGHKLFLADGCFECHGTVGQGGSAAPRIAPDPMPAEAISAYIRKPSGQMPPYSPKVLSEADIADIHAYLASIRKPDVDVGKVLGGAGKP
jgi:ubiquinol-cytochrome c reductase cytochrome c subunit